MKHRFLQKGKKKADIVVKIMYEEKKNHMIGKISN
jgi:hypothetical protein